MNADQERWVKFEAETNYNKRFRLTRRNCLRLRPTSEESSPRRRGDAEKTGPGVS